MGNTERKCQVKNCPCQGRAPALGRIELPDGYEVWVCRSGAIMLGHEKPMRSFRTRRVRGAIRYAANGGQALHLMPPALVPGREALTPFAHLFDQDRRRLVRTARMCGVWWVKLERRGERTQHVDLWGKPLVAAREIAAEETRLADRPAEVLQDGT